MKVIGMEANVNINGATTAPACAGASSVVCPQWRYSGAELCHTACSVHTFQGSPQNESCKPHKDARKISSYTSHFFLSVLGMGGYPSTPQFLSEEALTKYLLTCLMNNFPGISAWRAKISFAPSTNPPFNSFAAAEFPDHMLHSYKN